MAEEEWIVQTQESLGKLITKPKMTEKYLKKPPFRFLHDIVMEVTRTTTFGEGLFTVEESDAANLGDKAAKVEFLNKAISCTSFALGEKIDVLANKIVAGLEADKTNMWLQKLHAAATTCAGDKSAEAVSRVLAGETVAAPKREKKKREEEPAADKPAEGDGAGAEEEAKKEEDRKRRAEKKKREEEKRRRAEEEAAKQHAEEGGAPEAPPAPPADAEAEEEQRKKEEARKKKEEQKKRHEEKKRQQAEEEARRQAEEQEAAQQAAFAAQQQAAADAAAAEAAAQQQWAAQQQAEADAQALAMQQQAAAAEDERARMMMDQGEAEGLPSMPSSAAQNTRPGDGPPGSADVEAMLAAQAEGVPGEEMGAGMGRPARVERPRTAGRKPPKVTSKVTTRQDEPGLSGGVAPPTIITEGQKDDHDEDDLFEAPEQPGFMSVVKADQNAPHGKLVRDLLAEKSEMEDKEKERLRKEEEDTREEVDDGATKGIKMGRLKRKKDQSSSYSDIDVAKLSETIQQLCQAANPLGKSIDLVHQDIANMGKELDHWKQEYREASEQYQNELKMTDELLQPLDQKIAELNERITEQKTKIRNSRSRISKNDLRIQSLLESVVLAK
mmetsp:Transcript_47118/g.82934  ORF Transcript_47118/g.82934 Transcript_47118/m.82934 type:complete len:613 (+) Transcript_47118:142-1980(+)